MKRHQLRKTYLMSQELGLTKGKSMRAESARKENDDFDRSARLHRAPNIKKKRIGNSPKMKGRGMGKVSEGTRTVDEGKRWETKGHA